MICFKKIKWRNLLSTGNQWTEINLNKSQRLNQYKKIVKEFSKKNEILHIKKFLKEIS